MNNHYVNVKCPSCHSTIQLKSQSIRSDTFYRPVCECGEIDNPVSLPATRFTQVRQRPANRVPVLALVR
jgi:hypothetical protein